MIDRNVIITAKKLFALALLHPCYEHIITSDAELRVAAPLALVAAVKEWVGRGGVLVSRWPGYSDMVVASADGFPPAAKQAAREATEGWTLWPWWSEPPIYVAADVPLFLEFLDWPARAPSQFNEFDHLSYVLWKVAVRREWVFHEANRVAPQLDGPWGNVGEAAVWKAVAGAWPPGPIWATAYFCSRNSALCSQPGSSIVLHHHCDRGSAPWWRSEWKEETGGAGVAVAEVEEGGGEDPWDTSTCPRAGTTHIISGIE